MTAMRKISPDGATAAVRDGLGDSDFARFSALIHDRTGIRLTPSKRAHIEGKLRKRAALLGLDSVTAYSRMIFEAGGLDAEFDTLMHLATTNKTDFFRENAHFDLLDKTLLPALLKARPRGAPARLKVWSAAASNGAEAFTTAMVLAEAAARGPKFDFAILGTDLSSEMVAEARRAIYPAAMIAPVPEALRRRYFMVSRGADAGVVRVVPELRQRVRFQQLNLVAEKLPVDRDIDVIFLRNVLIYFDPPTQKAVVRRLAGHLRQSGYLILGHTEAAIGNGMGFDQVGTGVFRVA